MPVVLRPADSAVFAYNPVLHIVQTAVPAVGDLIVNGLLHRLEVLRMDNAPEGSPGQLFELLPGIAAKNAQNSVIGVNQIPGLLGAVDEKSSGHQFPQPLHGGKVHPVFGQIGALHTIPPS